MRQQFTNSEIKQLNIINTLKGKSRLNAIKMHMLTYKRTYSSIASKLHKMNNVPFKRTISRITPVVSNTTTRELRFNIKSLTINNNQVIITY